MTYQEIKDRLSKCELALNKIKDGTYSSTSTVDLKKAKTQLEVLKESLTKKLALLKEADEEMGDDGFVATDDEDKAEVLAKKGVKVKLTKEQEGIEFSADETKVIAKEVGKALIGALREVGDEIETVKGRNIEPNSFEIYVKYKNDFEDEFSFYITGDTLHLVDYSFDKEIGDVGVKPSGEAIVHVDVIKNNLVKHFKSLNEQSGNDQYLDKLFNIILKYTEDPDDAEKELDNYVSQGYNGFSTPLQANLSRDMEFISLVQQGHDEETYNKEISEEQTPRERYLTLLDMYKRAGRNDREDLKPKLEKAAAQLGIKLQLSEAPEGMFYIEVAIRDARQAIGILDDKYSKQVMFNGSNVYYFSDEQTTYDVLEDFGANDIEVVDTNLDLFAEGQIKEMNPKEMKPGTYAGVPVVVHMHGPETKWKVEFKGKSKFGPAGTTVDYADAIANLKTEGEGDDHHYIKVPRAQYKKAMSILNNAAEPSFVKMNTVDDDGAGNVIIYFMFNEFADDFDVEEREAFMHDAVMDLQANGIDVADHSAELYEATDYAKRRAAEKDYQPSKKDAPLKKYKEPKNDYFARRKAELEEDIDVGHQDDEPDMLKQYAYDIATYAAKLYKQLDKYDKMDAEVDFPNWWQSKVILARDYISKAQHYLEFEEKQPALDALALEGKEGASAEEEEKFHKKLDTLVHKTFGKRKEEMNEYNVNPEAEKYVKRFISGVAQKYGYDEMDAVHLIYQVLANTGYLDMRLESINERVGALQDFINLVRDRAVDSEFSEQEEALEVIEALADHYGIKIQTGGFVGEAQPTGFGTGQGRSKTISKGTEKNPELKATLKAQEPKKPGKYVMKNGIPHKMVNGKLTPLTKVVKEYTDNSFSGAELIDNVSKNSPDMFAKQVFADILPKGVASENDAIEALKAHDKSPIKARMGQYAPMFVHVQYHDLEHEGEKYQMHQTQYYNSNFKDKDPDFNPGVTRITLFKGDENLGSILVKTDAYVEDLRNLPGLGDRVSEVVKEEKATCCGKCGRVHVKGTKCKRPFLTGKDHCRNN